METVPELYMREALGVVTTSQYGVFTASQIDRFSLCVSMDSKRFSGQRDDLVFVGVDPTGGGSSKLAIISTLCSGGKLILVSTTISAPPTLKRRILRMLFVQCPSGDDSGPHTDH